MYLFILEDGNICKAATVTDDDKLMVDAGILSVVDMETEKEYHNGEWIDVEVYEVYGS